MDLIITDLPETVVDRLRQLAERHGRSVEDEALALLERLLGLEQNQPNSAGTDGRQKPSD